MRRINEIFKNIISDKKQFRIFISSGIVLFILLLCIFIGASNANNYTIETSKIANAKLERTENEDDVLVVEIESKPVQSLSDEEQKEAEVAEKIENEDDSANNVLGGYETSYYIKVNYGANVVTIYSKASDGNYNPMKAMVCSSGRATPTSGVYKTKSSKHRWGALFGGVWGQYTTQIVGNILFHSVPYLSSDPSDLEYWEYDKLGTTASAGCIRLRVCDAKWIYDNIPTGTPVEFYSDSNPGPLGKPAAQKISDNEQFRGWDPTDPNSNNPWNGYSESTIDNIPEQQYIEPEPVIQNEQPEQVIQPEQQAEIQPEIPQQPELQPEVIIPENQIIEEQPKQDNNNEQNEQEQQDNNNPNTEENNGQENTNEGSEDEKDIKEKENND